MGVVRFLVMGYPPWLVLTLLLLLCLAQLARLVLRRWREQSALRLAPAVYQAGGDAADVLRAINEDPRP